MSQKAVFLDRDGVINNNDKSYYVYKIENFDFNDGAIEAMQLLQKKGYIIVVISNQGGISKKFYEKEDAELLHKQMIEILAENGLSLAEIYYCPHHDENERCLCRKPQGLMIEKAIARFGIDKKQSFMIGDNEIDVLAAKNAGISGYRIKANTDLRNILKKIPEFTGS
ncbi:MAG TPA: HAD family hydrolase [Bacteroidales bacterium]|nr:HAD family hydrolase [Bacteroidales bacterium]